jgi:hypothetical protein
LGSEPGPLGLRFAGGTGGRLAMAILHCKDDPTKRRASAQRCPRTKNGGLEVPAVSPRE